MANVLPFERRNIYSIIYIIIIKHWFVIQPGWRVHMNLPSLCDCSALVNDLRIQIIETLGCFGGGGSGGVG